MINGFIINIFNNYQIHDCIYASCLWFRADFVGGRQRCMPKLKIRKINLFCL